MEHNDYLKFDNKQITRPIASVYEISHVLSELSVNINESPNLKNYVDTNGEINDIINPAEIATNLIKENKYDAWLKRDNENIKYSSLYINPIYYDLLLNYFNKQHKITNEYVISKLTQK